MKKRFMKLAAITMAAAVAIGGVGAVNAFATSTTHAPTTAKTIPTNIVTATAHRAATPLPDMLGANVPSGYGMINGYGSSTIAQNAIGNFALEVWGSSLNSNPDPYWWNYYYNFNGGNESTSNVLLNEDGQGSPVKADTNTSSTYGGVSASIYTKPDVLIGVDTSNSYTGDYTGYDAQIDIINDTDPTYDPELSRYDPTSLTTMISTVNEAAAAINATGKTTRYSADGETPSVIAAEYSNYINGIRGYITNQIGAANFKTIAIVSGVELVNGANVYTLDGPGSSASTSTNRFVEYTQGYTNNLISTSSSTKSISDLLDVDAIIITSDDVETALKEELPLVTTHNTQNGQNARIKPELISMNEMETLYGIRMNSVENALGMGYILGRIYDQDYGFLSAKNVYKYFAEKFYHIDTTKLDEILDKAIIDNLDYYVESNYIDVSDTSTPVYSVEDDYEVDQILNDSSTSYDSSQMKTLLEQYASGSN